MKECPTCFAEIGDPDAGQCPICGADFARKEESASAEEAGRPGVASLSDSLTLFRRQFEERSVEAPAEFVERARRFLTEAETEIRWATVLIADLHGFSKRGREMSPERLAGLANEFYRLCSNCVMRRGGFVVKFLGDATLAVFGAPVAFDRDTESAVRAALDIREQCERITLGGEKMAACLGLATGPMTCGLIEGPSGRTFDVIGDTVNLAARLQGAAGPNEIFICSQTYDAARRWFESEPTDPLHLKNLSDAYVAQRIVDERQDLMAGDFAEPPFRGRGAEVAALVGALNAPEAIAQVIHVVGEAGLGKSRLIREALRAAGRECDAVVWEATPGCEAILLWPVLQWLRRAMNLAPQSESGALRDAAADFLKTRLPGQDADPLLLEYLFGSRDAIEAVQGMPPERIQTNLLGLLRQLVFAEFSADGRGILVLENAQWLDPLTKELARRLLNAPPSGGLTLIQANRPEAKTPVDLGREPLVIHLQHLTDTERADLLAALAPTKEFLPEMRNLVLSRAAGNPLFIAEMTRLIQHVMRNNANMNGEALTARIVEIMPASLRELIQSRIDRLDARNRQVLQCASLLGLEFAFSLLELFDIIRDGLAGHLHALRALRYLEQFSREQDPLYHFVHGLYRDVAYSTLLEEQKRNLHLRLGRRLEEAFGDRLPEYYELLAFHFSHGGETQKAIYYLIKAAGRQASLGAGAQALENYAEAIELLRGLPPDPGRQALMARALTHCGRLHRMLGQPEESGECLEGALELARRLNNERLELEARLELAVSRLWRGELEEAKTELEELRETAIGLKAAPAEVVILNSLGVIHWRRGELEPALQNYQSLAERAESIGATHLVADALNNAGLIYWRWGQHDEAQKALREAIKRRRLASDTYGTCATLMNLGIIQEQIGRVGAARKAYMNARLLAEKTGFVQAVAAVENNLSNLDRRMGALAEALEHAWRALDFARRAGDKNLEAAAEENIGLASALKNEPDAAREHLQRALDIHHANGDREAEVGARLSMIEFHSASSPEHSHLAEINIILEIIDTNKYHAHKPRAYRVKAAILDALDEHNHHTAREYLNMAQDLAKQEGAFFEERETLKAMFVHAEKHGDKSQQLRLLNLLKKMEFPLWSS